MTILLTVGVFVIEHGTAAYSCECELSDHGNVKGRNLLKYESPPDAQIDQAKHHLVSPGQRLLNCQSLFFVLCESMEARGLACEFLGSGFKEGKAQTTLSQLGWRQEMLEGI